LASTIDAFVSPTTKHPRIQNIPLTHVSPKQNRYSNLNLVIQNDNNKWLQTPPRITTTRLTTTNQDDDDDVDPSKPMNIFQKAKFKFQSRPGTYLMIPVIAAFVGWFTNYLAVQMIFYPIEFMGLPIWRRPEIPLGLVGWQGIVPCKTKTMSKALVEMVTTQLLTVPEAFAKLNPHTLAQYIAPQVPQLGTDVITDLATKSAFPLNLWNGATHYCSSIFQFVNIRILSTVMKDLITNCQDIFSLENCVVNQMVMDRSKLGQLFQNVGRKELDFLTNSGLWFGFLLGLIQMAVALVWENPWSLSIGGMIVGLATNWLALKWIFEPVYPTKIGPFIIQGMFLRRQPEVAAEFSKFFATKIVNSQQIWNSILTDPSTTPALASILSRHVGKLLNIVSLGLFQGIPSDGLIQKVTSQTIKHLPKFLPPGLHQYVDKTLGLETILRVKMEAMSPTKFERVLHPIFEEDELTLIIAGGVLGFAAGLIQQGLETGAIKLTNPLPRIRKTFQKLRNLLLSIAKRFRNILGKSAE
jgi:uncharacterized membrane protein YheB (UPF0754 family)